MHASTAGAMVQACKLGGGGRGGGGGGGWTNCPHPGESLEVQSPWDVKSKKIERGNGQLLFARAYNNTF